MVLGQVKWFNAKAGFGFITVGGADVFAHHSEIKVRKEQFRYLVEGEYVELKVSKKMGEEKSQGSEITGVEGGRLMCEVRSEASESANEYKASAGTGGGVRERSSGAGSSQRTRTEAVPREVRERAPKRPSVSRVSKKDGENVVQQMRHKPTAELA
jgi:cold shock CspA family protein